MNLRDDEELEVVWSGGEFLPPRESKPLLEGWGRMALKSLKINDLKPPAQMTLVNVADPDSLGEELELLHEQLKGGKNG